MGWNWLEFTPSVVVVGELNSIGLTSRLLLRVATRCLLASEFGPTFHSMLCAGYKTKDGPEEALAALWMPSFLSREEPKSPAVGTRAPCTTRATARCLGHRPAVSPRSSLEREQGRPGRPGGRATRVQRRQHGSGETLCPLGANLCAPYPSSFDLNFVLASPKQIVFPMPTPVFSPVVRGIQKTPRPGDCPTKQLPDRQEAFASGLQPRNSETGICSGRTWQRSPHSSTPTARPEHSSCSLKL